MGTEIDIAGTFLHLGMKELDKIIAFRYESEIFSFLYHVAVGIERIQKVLIVLLEELSDEQLKEFENSLYTHNHHALHERISKRITCSMSKHELSFLHLLSDFYRNSRYMRFSVNGKFGPEKEAIHNFISTHCDKSTYEIDFFTGAIMNTSTVKALFGKIIGSISNKYYEQIYEQAGKLQLYTYELRSGSPAEKVFLLNNPKHSLQKQMDSEQLALKELIIYLMNTKEKDALFNFIHSIEPLDFDPALIKEYLENVCKGEVPQDLIDAVEYQYDNFEDKTEIKERLEKISLIGNSQVYFKEDAIIACYNMLKSFVSGDYEYLEFASDFPLEFAEIDDDSILAILHDVPEWCDRLLSNGNVSEKNRKEFLDQMTEIFSRLKQFCAYEE